MDLVRKGAHGGRSRDSFWGEEGELPFPMCLRDEAIDGCRVKAAFNPWANRLFEFCRVAVGFTWCLFHVFDRHQATRVGCNYLFYWLYARSCLEGEFEPLDLSLIDSKDVKVWCRRGDSLTLLFYSAFQAFFDFPQYSDTLGHRTIHTIRTNRTIL